MSAWALSDASLRCLVRRAEGAARSAPLPALLAVAAFIAAPILLARAGVAFGAVAGPLLTEPRAARAVAATLFALSALAGATISLALPGPRALGAQAAAAPIAPRRALVASWVVPLMLVLATVAPSALGLLLPLAASSPGGWAVAPVLVVTVLAGGLVGAAVGEAGRLGMCREATGTPIVGLLVVIWLLAGTIAGEPLLGPLVVTGDALGGGGIWQPLLALGLVGLGAAAGWLVLSPRSRDVRHASAPRPLPRVGGGRATVLGTAAVALIVRRRDMRVTALTALVAGTGMLGLSRLAGEGGHVSTTSATFVAALAAAPVALAATGAALDGRRIWLAAPVRVPAVALSWCHAGIATLLLVAMALALPLAATLRVPLAALGLTAVTVAAIGAIALIAGASVPWHDGGVGDQLPSIAALAVGLAVVGVAAAEATEWLVGIGVTVLAATLLVTALLLVAAVGAVTVRVERRV